MAGLENAAKRRLITEAQKLVAFDPNDEESIEDGLLREVRHSSQIAKAYAEIISEMENMPLIQRTPRDGEKLSALIDAWTQERTTHARLAKLAIDAGIDKRRLELAETHAQQVVWILVKVLQSPLLQLTPQQQLVGRQVAAEVLRTMPHGNNADMISLEKLDPHADRSGWDPATSTSFAKKKGELIDVDPLPSSDSDPGPDPSPSNS